MTYSICDIEMITHPDGRNEVLVSDETLKLVLDGLDKMKLSLPITEEQEDIVFEYLVDLDIEIGQVESENIRPTVEYNDRVGRAVDEFNHGLNGDFIDYDKVNRRLAELLEELGTDGRYTLDYERWQPREEKKPKIRRK